MRWMMDPTATNDDTVAFPPSPLGPPNPHRRHGYDGRRGHDGDGYGYGDGYELGKPPPEPRPGEGDARQIFAHRTPRLGADKPYGRPDSPRAGPLSLRPAPPRMRLPDPAWAKETLSFFFRARPRQFETRNRRNR